MLYDSFMKSGSPAISSQITPAMQNRMAPATILRTAAELPPLAEKKAIAKNKRMEKAYAGRPNSPNRILLIPLPTGPSMPKLHKKRTTATAKNKIREIS